MNWLQGGPYYELSFLIKNSENKVELLKSILSRLKVSTSFEAQDACSEIENKINEYRVGEEDGGIVHRNIEIEAIIQIAGARKSRLNILELSKELVKLNFWFYGSIYADEEWDQKSLRVEDKPAFRSFFNLVQNTLDPILGTIAFEEDCEELFLTDVLSPNKFYTIKNLKLGKIQKRLSQKNNEYEYFWAAIDTFDNKEDIEIETG